MNKKTRRDLFLLFVLIVVFILLVTLTGCQSCTKNMGGTTVITLKPGEKLEEITWKDNSLWYLTRPMRDDEFPEEHHFQQSSNYGIIEGEVIIKEKTKE